MGEDGLAFLVDAGGIVRVDSRRLGDDVPLVVLSLDKGGLQLAPKFSEDGVVILGARIVVEKGNGDFGFRLFRFHGQKHLEEVNLVPCEVAAVADAEAGTGGENGETVKVGFVAQIARIVPDAGHLFVCRWLMGDFRLVRDGTLASLVFLVVDLGKVVFKTAVREVGEDAFQDENVFAEGLPGEGLCKVRIIGCDKVAVDVRDQPIGFAGGFGAVLFGPLGEVDENVEHGLIVLVCPLVGRGIARINKGVFLPLGVCSREVGNSDALNAKVFGVSAGSRL